MSFSLDLSKQALKVWYGILWEKVTGIEGLYQIEAASIHEERRVSWSPGLSKGRIDAYMDG